MQQPDDQDLSPEPSAGREIVVAPAVSIGQPLGFLTKELVAELEEQVTLLKRLKLVCLRVTDPGDWRGMDGKPYLQDSGVQKVAGAIRLTFGKPVITEQTGEDKRGKWCRFTCAMTAVWNGRTQDDEGISSTRDEFFGRKNQQDRPYEEIDIESVRKKSITNAQHRLLTKMMGIGGLTWKQLKESAGIDAPPAETRYKGSEQRQTTGAGGWSKTKERIWGLLLELAGGDEPSARERLFALTENREKNFRGKRDPSELTDSSATYILGLVERDYKKAFGQLPPSDGRAEVGPPPPEPGEAG